MIKKFLIATIMFASVVFANNPYGYTSSEETAAAAGVLSKTQETQTSAPKETQYDDFKMALALHPVSLIVDGVQGLIYFYVTFELGFGNRFSLITRPGILSGDYDGTTNSGFSINEGFRFYLSGRGHRGWYLEPQFMYLSNDVSNGRHSGSISMVGIELLLGRKVMNGHFVFGYDLGLRFTSTNKIADAGVDFEVIGDGLGIDLNLYLGFAF